LKVVVHSGRAVFNTVGGFSQVSGTDVILAHRLLKNSVPSHEYLLMTEAAYRDLGREMSGEFVKGEEDCEGLGHVTTYVKFMGKAFDRERELFYSLSPDTFKARLREYLRWNEAPAHVGAALEQFRHPIKPVGWLKRAGFLVYYVFGVPLTFLYFSVAIPRRMLSRKESRARIGPHPRGRGAGASGAS
jgi:Protein of unknown function (DUF2652)